ncbi:metalloregulator ArsR/SmtB family transcription factor [Natronolimnohabitans sp. A-GB9]|uniref:ArsR/SmtB family transcription factor n=1 Tax=Natronolimnohabitans sp. A-GB9 TaxID=3069757 RepID=UPI0027B230BA|nr:metalloregulator ArsR/SmtB family transcription factor [Natronolimnohabitans sp. A-GB9]MDQ2050170.1 metalloregulator ArsR/SmtB family transcription factor [Natronolimnohabitans sp. A-GB9]
MTDRARIDDGTTESASKTINRMSEGACCEEAFPANRRISDEEIDGELSVFKALANEKRLRIIEALRDGELCACELETILDAPQSTVGTHLSRLREAGIVRTRKDGKWTYYRIADTASLQLLDLARALSESDR